MSLLCRLKKLVRKGELSTKDLDRIVILPKDATNGDVIKAMFPDTEVREKNGVVLLRHGCEGGSVWSEWWNNPYRKEKNGNN